MGTTVEQIKKYISFERELKKSINIAGFFFFFVRTDDVLLRSKTHFINTMMLEIKKKDII